MIKQAPESAFQGQPTLHHADDYERVTGGGYSIRVEIPELEITDEIKQAFDQEFFRPLYCTFCHNDTHKLAHRFDCPRRFFGGGTL